MWADTWIRPYIGNTMTGYTDTIRRWAIDSRRAGPLADADGIGEVGLGADEAGRRLAVRFAIKVDGERIETVRFEVFGCGFTIAACTVAAELSEGRPLEEAAALGTGDIDAELEGLPPEREYCAGLAVEALHAAVASARSESKAVQVSISPADERGSGGSADDPLYQTLLNTPCPPKVSNEDRHLFACLLNAAARAPHTLAAGLGLEAEEVDAILAIYFPGINRDVLDAHDLPPSGPPPERNDDVLEILLSHVPKGRSRDETRVSTWLAHIIAARAAYAGHLWTAMGFFERPELTATIRRHLPSLAAANDKGMRWKRYLFKQVCDLGGGVMCKAPDCGVCSDYAFCFGDEKE